MLTVSAREKLNRDWDKEVDRLYHTLPRACP